MDATPRHPSSGHRGAADDPSAPAQGRFLDPRLYVVIIYPLVSAFFKIRWHHLDRMPARGGVLVAVNHISQADTTTMARLIWQSGRIPRFLIKSGVFGWRASDG